VTLIDEIRRSEALESWFARKLNDSNIRIVEFEQMTTGQSNDTYSIRVDRGSGSNTVSEDFVLRTTPSGPGLVEPYDMPKQYQVMAALATSTVPVPAVLWLEEDEAVIGRIFFVMERLFGTVFELTVPEYLQRGGPEKLRRMSVRFVEALAELHGYGWEKGSISHMNRGPGSASRELEWWRSQILRVQRGPLPAIDALYEWLRSNVPAEPARSSLLHGDCKWGNIMWDDENVQAVLDWEMSQIGDPLIDVGYATMLWDLGGPAQLPGVISSQEFLTIYEQLTGTNTAQINWYQILATFKVVAICLVGSMLFATGESNSLRYAAFGCGIEGMVGSALRKARIGDAFGDLNTMADATLISQRVAEVVYSILLPELSSEVAEAQALAIPMLFSYYAQHGDRS
jgi:aminoglycoside phosphotransferase (APT) family kinase protein